MIKDPTNELKRALKAANFAACTQRAYLKAFRAFFVAHNLNIDNLASSEINNYLATLPTSAAGKTAAALKFYYAFCRDKQVNLFKPIRETTSTEILTREEIKSILDAAEETGKRFLFEVIYYLALRRREIMQLKPADISGEFIIIRDPRSNGGGRQLKNAKLAASLSDLAKTTNQPANKPFFEITAAELQTLFKNVLKRAGITKPATLHTLRHSAATHLFESGVNVLSIQKFLGHKSLNTTMIYIKNGADAAEVKEL